MTIVTHERHNHFGKVFSGETKLDIYGMIASQEWYRSAEIRPHIILNPEEFVVMPNHIHGIVWINDSDPNVVGAQRRCAPTNTGNCLSVQKGSLGAFIRAYKSAVTYCIHKEVGNSELTVWQRNYYEHIIRSDEDYARIVDYIANNPANWEQDEEFRR